MQAPPKEPIAEPPPERPEARHRPLSRPLRLLAAIAVSVAAGAALAAALAPAVGALGVVTKKVADRIALPPGASISFPRFPESSTIFAKDGSILATVHLDQNRQIVHLDHVAPIARKAVLAIEDYQFYQHGAVDPKSILRAALANFRSGHFVQGGSTITQQLVKNVTGQTADTLKRKIREAELAVKVEQRYSKDQILELYLNEIYLGNGVYGIETASEYYFGRRAAKLTLPQAATLAGLIRAPAIYDPIAHSTAALSRRNTVLARMAELGWIPKAVADQAMAEPLRLSLHPKLVSSNNNPFFVQYIVNQILQDKDGEFDSLGTSYNQRRQTLFQGGLKVYTTLNPKWETWGLNTIRAHLPKASDPQAGLATIEVQTGAIRALVSGRNFVKTRTDFVTGTNGRGAREAGSAFKPFTLVAAFREGIPPGKVYSSKSPTTVSKCIPPWTLSNAEGAGDMGYINLWTATQLSINVVFAQLSADVGPANIVTAAHDMGITSPLPAVCSLTLGTGPVSPLEMADGYSTLAHNGIHCPAYAVDHIRAPGGKTVYKHHPANACKQAITPDIAHQVTAMLERVIQGGTGTRAYLGRPAAGKTGTGEQYRNAWFVGYVPQYTTAVWIGYVKNVSMYNVEGFSRMFGGDIPAEIWHDYMMKITAGLPAIGFPGPPPEPHGTVPKVVGMLQDPALKTLADANFTGVVKTMKPSTKPKGTVISQSPAPGSDAVLGSEVDLTVSNGVSPLKVVPNVTGMKKADAIALLRARGFKVVTKTVDVTDPLQDGIVESQSPAAGQKRKPGTTVTIVVGKYVAPSPSPSPSPT